MLSKVENTAYRANDAAAAGLGFSPSAGNSASSIARKALCRRCCQRMRFSATSSAGRTAPATSALTVAGNRALPRSASPRQRTISPFQLSAALTIPHLRSGLLDFGGCHKRSEKRSEFQRQIASGLAGSAQDAHHSARCC